MRKTSIILILSLLAICTNGQQYHPFPDSGALWREFFIHHSGPVDRIEDRYSISTGGDTIIQGIQYVTLWKTGVLTEYDDHNQIINITTVVNSYAGGVREDSIKRIYIRSINERLLYDFSLNVNDSLVGNYIWTLPSSTYVSSIDSIFDGNIYRKQFHISVPGLGYDYIQLIEGIGSTWGLFNFFAPQLPSWGNLYCFTDGQSNLILDTVQCNALNGMEKITTNNIIVYPNPASSYLYFKNIPTSIQSLEYFDISGRNVRTNTDYNENTGDDISFLLPGLYFVKVKSKFNSYSFKVVKE